jgi:hypothetical protein
MAGTSGLASGGWSGDGRVSCWKVTDTERLGVAPDAVEVEVAILP